MAWTAPRTWTTAELVTAAIMNTHVRDNLIYLKAAVDAGMPGITYINHAPTFSTSATAFALAGGLAMLDITLLGGHLVLYGATMSTTHNTANAVRNITMYIDGVNAGGTSGLSSVIDKTDGVVYTQAFTGLRAGLAVGSHNFQLRWKTSAGILSTDTATTLSLWAVELTKRGP